MDARRAALLVLLLVSGCAGANGAATTVPTAAAASPGERLWRAKCGACHVPVQPATRARAQLEAALARHRTRVRMSEPDWRAVIDFLARPEAPAAP